jgi:competence protein ComEC
VQAAVTLALLPLTVVLFHQVSLVSPLANALAIPVVSYLVTPLALVGAACAMLPGVFDLPAVPLLHAAHGVFALLIAVLEVMDAWPAASVAIAAPPPLLLLPALAGVGWCLAPGWPLRPVGVLWLVPLVCWPAPRPSAGALWVTALDVGQGMAMVVQTASATVLYDTGPRYTADSDAGARVVLPWLRSQGIARLDALVLSHLDADHSGGYRAIAAALPVGDVLTSIAPDAALLGGRAVTGCAVGQRRRYGELVLEVLHPGADDPAGRSSTNARSCVVRAGAHGHHVLLTGDVPAAQEHVLLSRAGGSALAVDVLVAPHHGSRTSSTDALLVAAAPRWVAIQVGYRSRYGHPHRVVLDRLAAHGLPVLRTDHHGAIRWRFDADGTVNVDRQRLDHRRYWHDQPGGLASADSPAAGPAAPASSVDAVADEAGMSDDAPVRRIATPVNVDAPSSDLDPIGLPGP